MPLRNVNIKQHVKLINIDFSQNLRKDFQFFLDHQKIITCSTSVSSCKPKIGQFLFDSHFQVFVSVIPIPKHGLLDLSPHLQGSRSGLTQQRIVT